LARPCAIGKRDGTNGKQSKMQSQASHLRITKISRTKGIAMPHFDIDYRMITLKTSDGASIRGKVNIAPNQRGFSTSPTLYLT
jgi:hypothetical protein